MQEKVSSPDFLFVLLQPEGRSSSSHSATVLRTLHFLVQTQFSFPLLPSSAFASSPSPSLCQPQIYTNTFSHVPAVARVGGEASMWFFTSLFVFHSNLSRLTFYPIVACFGLSQTFLPLYLYFLLLTKSQKDSLPGPHSQHTGIGLRAGNRFKKHIFTQQRQDQTSTSRTTSNTVIIDA